MDDAPNSDSDDVDLDLPCEFLCGFFVGFCVGCVGFFLMVFKWYRDMAL